MLQIAIQVSDEQKAKLLIEMLSAMNFVKTLEVSEVNGNSKFTQDVGPMPYIGPEYNQMQREEAAFSSLKPTLLMKYSGKFAAFFQEQLVDHDADELLLLGRINKKYPDQIVLIRQVLEQSEPPLMFRSPRLLKEKL